MIYELVNPSDEYTLKTDSFKAACVASLLLGNGHYPLDPIETSGESVPFFLRFDDAVDWVQDRFDCTVDELVERVDHVMLADCLESVLIGNREIYESAIKHMAPDAHNAFHQEWHDKNRSSLNDIGQRACDLAKALRAAENKPQGEK